MNVDQILNDTLGALELPDGAIPVSVIVLCEYAEPGADNAPGRLRLAMCSDENMPPWTSLGMMRYATEIEIAEICATE